MPSLKAPPLFSQQALDLNKTTIKHEVIILAQLVSMRGNGCQIDGLFDKKVGK